MLKSKRVIRMPDITMGSLFDGSGTFPLAAKLNGITPVWASEIEPFPIRVTTKRLPEMKHLGDICRINGGEIPPVDLVTFGSPCQNCSYAGDRTGILGKKSSLFFEAIRIIEEMLAATGNAYPSVIVMENVPGLLSSTQGNDIKRVLHEFSRLGFAVDINILQAQYMGVPQRRNRVFIVGVQIRLVTASSLKQTVPRAKAIDRALEGFDGLQFYGIATAQFTPIQTFLRDILEDSPDPKYNLSQKACEGILRRADLRGKTLPKPLDAALRNQSGDGSLDTYCFEPGAASRLGGHCSKEYTCTIRAQMGDNLAAVVVPVKKHEDTGIIAVENYPANSRVKLSADGMAQTLTSKMGTGGCSVPMVMSERQLSLPVTENIAQTLMGSDYKGVQCVCEEKRAFGICSQNSNAMLSHNPKSGIYEAETARTLDTNGSGPACNQGGVAVVEAYALQGSMIGRKDKNGPQGSGVNKDVSFTLNTADRHSVAYAPDSTAAETEYIVRRLSIMECLRLMGLPDSWCSHLETENPTEEEIAFWTEVFETHRKVMGTSSKPKSRYQIIKWLKNPYSDSAVYKLCGNGIVRQCAEFIMDGIVRYYTQINRK